jgi:hypothetical protein
LGADRGATFGLGILMKVKDCLGFFWWMGDGHREVAGIVFYGYSRSIDPSIDVDSLRLLWTSLRGEIQTIIESIPERDTFESVESGSIITCKVRLDCWPNDKEWREAVEETLRTIANSEGSVAWCGGELCGWSPDELDPNLGGACVYAGFAEGVGFLCESPNSSDEYKDLSDESRLALHRVLCSR